MNMLNCCLDISIKVTLSGEETGQFELQFLLQPKCIYLPSAALFVFFALFAYIVFSHIPLY